MVRPCRSTLLALLAAIRVVSAQEVPLPVAVVPYPVGSGLLRNAGNDFASAWSTLIAVPGATSMQLALGRVALESDQDVLIVTDPTSGEIQRFDRTRLRQWSHHSAWFNAAALVVELRLAPGSTAEVNVEHVLCTFDSGSPDSLCDADNRLLATSSSLCRFVSSSSAGAGGSTGFLLNADNIGAAYGTVVCGAGSSVGGSIVIAQFEVPASNASGTIVHPPVADQYPVDQTSIRSENTGTGNNWAVMRLHPNSSGQPVESRQGNGLPIASGLPALSTQLQVNSFGDDSEPTRNYVQQFDRGPYTFQLGDTISYWVDTTTGSIGAPVMIDSSNEVIGIHNSGGCNPLLLQSNNGTNIFNAALQTAIQATASCVPTVALSSSAVSSTNIACTPRGLALTPSNSSWNLVAARADFTAGFGDDIALALNGITSDQPQGLCEFLVSNGNLNPNLAPGTAYVLQQGASPIDIRAQFQTATSFGVGNSAILSWDLVGTNGASDVEPTIARILEFEVTTAGTHDITVNGPDGLLWRLYAPGTDTAWRRRSEAPLASGTVGRDTVDGVALGTGWHAIVVFEDLVNGTQPFPLLRTYYVPEVAVTIHPAIAKVTLAANAAATTLPTTPDYQDFGVAPSANAWNAVALTNVPGTTFDPNWNLYLGAAASRLPSLEADWVVANARLGTVPADEGVMTRGSVPGSSRVQFVTETALGSEQLAAGRQVAVHNLGTQAGTFDVGVTGGGDETLRWALVSAADAQWIESEQAVAEDVVGGNLHQAPLADAGIVVVRDDGPATSAIPYSVHAIPQATPIAFATLGDREFVNGDRTFTVVPSAGNWNAIGVVGSAGTNFDVHLGTGESERAVGLGDFVVADGSAGTIPTNPGFFRRRSGGGQGSAQLATVTAATSFSTVNLAFTPSGAGGGGQAPTPADVLKIVQYDATVAGPHEITFGGAAASFAVFTPRPSSRWYARSDAMATGIVGTTVTVTLPVGRCAIVVHGDAAGPGGTVSVTVVPPAPLPTLTGLTPSSGTAGAAGQSLSLTGSGFTPNSSVRFGATAVTTAFVSATQLSASVPAGLLANAGIISVTVVNPAPGGGTSQAIGFTLNNPAPNLVSVSPANVTALGPQFLLTCSGSGFSVQSVVRWNGTNLATGFTSSTQLTATVPASLIAQPGTASVTVASPGPGGGTSATSTVTIHAPGPVLLTLSPPSTTAGGAGFTLTCDGLSFVNTSVVRWNAQNLATTFVNATRLTATVPPALIADGGFAAITVFTPPPSGGTSSPTSFVVNNPVPAVQTMTPVSVTAGGASFLLTVDGSGFVPSTTVRLDTTTLATTFVSPTRVQATVPASAIAAAGTAQVNAFNPAPAGGLSNATGLSILNPAPVLASSAPGFLLAGSPPTGITVNGLRFTVQSRVQLDGTDLTTTFVTATQLAAQLPASLLVTPRAATLRVFNPAPGGGLSGTLGFPIRAPRLTAMTPTVIPLLAPGGPSVSLSLTGTDFHASAIVYANQVPLATTVVSATQLGATLPSSLVSTQAPGGLAVAVENFGLVPSNSLGLEVTDHQNVGTINTDPLGPQPGESFTVRLEGGVSASPFTLVMDPSNIPPIVPFPDPIGDFVLAVNPATLLPLIDGLGLYGPPSFISFAFDPAGTPPSGTFAIPGLVQPSPPIGVAVTDQFIYLDATHPLGFRLSHALSRYQL